MDSTGTKKDNVGKLAWVAIAAVNAGKILAFMKSVAVLKPVVTLLTAFGSVFAYSFMLGWEFAAGFVGMLFIHELGHVAAAKKRGFETSAPVFIPFLGALIMLRDMGDRDDEAFIGIGGPLIGGIAAAALLIPVVMMSNPPEILVGLCYLSLYLNVFNLIPIRPLDGGRITQAVGPVARYLAFVAVVALPFIFQATFVMIFWILALGYTKLRRSQKLLAGCTIQMTMLALQLAGVGYGTDWFSILFSQLLATFFNFAIMGDDEERGPSKDERPQLPRSRRWMWAICYILLAVALAGAMAVAQNYLPPEAVK